MPFSNFCVEFCKIRIPIPRRVRLKLRGLSHKTIALRLAKGMTLEQAVAEPVNRSAWATRRKNGGFHRMVTAFGKTMTLSAWSRETGIPRKVLSYRVGKNWDPERALTTRVMVSGEWQRASV